MARQMTADEMASDANKRAQAAAEARAEARRR